MCCVLLPGGHVNPIISISFALSGHQHAILSGLYVIAQVHCVSFV